MSLSSDGDPGARRSHVGAPSEPHEERRRSLDALAVLTGHTWELPSGFPDGLRPDVLRCDLSRNALFVGDAKEVETPGCIETRVRLLKYTQWLAAHVLGRGGTATLAVCFGPTSQARRWKATLEMLLHEAGIDNVSSRHERFGPGFNVVWAVCRRADPKVAA